jgi:preprotein translocase subunit SecF
MSKLNIKFYEKRNIFFAFSIGVMLIGVIFNIIYGTRLDIQFTGGAVIKYSYVGEINSNDIASLVQNTTGEDASVSINQNVKNAEGNADLNNITIQFAGTNALELDKQQAIASALNEQYPENNFKGVSSSSVILQWGVHFLLNVLLL